MTNKRLAGAFAALLVLDLALGWFRSSSFLTSLVGVAMVVVGVVLSFRVVRHTIRQAIWRLRNRLIVAYVFIAFVPIVLILALAGVGTYIVAGQVAVYLVTSELQRRAASLESHARFLSRAKAPNRTNAAL